MQILLEHKKNKQCFCSALLVKKNKKKKKYYKLLFENNCYHQ